MLDTGRFGQMVNQLIIREAARVGQVLTEDDEAFGLLARALRSWVVQPTNLDIMEARFDDDTVDNMIKFAKRVARRDKALAPQFATVEVLLDSVRGATIEQVLRSTKYDLTPRKASPKKK